MVAQGRYIVGVPVYPSPLDAPDWGWKRDERGVWVEVNRPEPIFYALHPAFDDADKMVDPDDYPLSMRSAVEDHNYIFTGVVRSIFSRGSEGMCSPQFLGEALEKHWRGEQRIRLFDASEGFTKTANLGDCGFVVHTREHH